MKKQPDGSGPSLKLAANPDILATLSRANKRAPLVIGFAAETEKVVEQAIEKRKAKGCDWIVANDVSGGVMGGNGCWRFTHSIPSGSSTAGSSSCAASGEEKGALGMQTKTAMRNAKTSISDLPDNGADP